MSHGFDRSCSAEAAAVIVVRNAWAARQWEAYLAADRTAGEAWLAPRVLPESVWAAELWAAHGGDALVLGRAQSLALWRSVIAESADAETLIGVDGAAEWAADAHRALRHWLVEPELQRAEPAEPDYRAFLRWHHDYRMRLRAHGWIDEPELAAALPALDVAPQRVVLASHAEPTPAQHALHERLAALGSTVERWAPGTPGAAASCIELADPAAELAAAAEWAKQRLDRAPTARLALVVPDLERRELEVERALDALGHAVWHGAARLGTDPLIGAALNAVELVTPRGTFATLSRWLRSSLLAGTESAARALLEARLRTRLAAQLPFTAAYRILAAEIERELPSVRAALDRALEAVRGSQLASPSRWAELWQRAVRALGWPPADGTPMTDVAVMRWEAALDALAALSPMVGAVSAERAFAELERIVESTSAAPPLPLAGVHVVPHPDDVGPGYDAAWLTGFTDRYWPETARANPLLPLRLQRRHGLPWSSPQDAQARSARSFGALLERTRELVFSWPARLLDQPAEPSPVLRGLPRYEAAAARPPVRAVRARETIADPAPPLEGTALVGGVRALDAQARCPIRAFCEHRLATRALEPVAVGFPARLQGIAAHRALELLYGTRRSSADLAPLADAAHIERCVAHALDETFGAARVGLAAAYEVERERLARLLRELIANDTRRTAFTIAALEERRTVEIGGWSIRIRLDRMDTLLDGTSAVIDYKTGTTASTADWFKERLRDTQLPLYAVHADGVSAAVLARLQAGAASYVGVWQLPGAFPGTPRKLPNDRTWSAQLVEWRRQLGELVAEYASGDVRIFVNGDLDDARGAYAPLTRAIEQLALARGAPPW